MAAKRKKKKKVSPLKAITDHFVKLGFTNRLALFIVLILILTIFMGFYLALKSIQYNYLGQLAAWTIAIGPLDTMLSIVLKAIVNKSLQENTSADGTGIVYAAAKANNFGVELSSSEDGPPI